MSNIETQLNTTEAPVPQSEVQTADIDLSAMIAAEREQLEKGLKVTLTPDFQVTTLGAVPAYSLTKISSAAGNGNNMLMLIEAMADLLVNEDQPRLKKFIEDNKISTNGIYEIYKSIIEAITGKTITPQPS